MTTEASNATTGKEVSKNETGVRPISKCTRYGLYIEKLT